MEYAELLAGRRSTRRFDTDRDVPDDVLARCELMQDIGQTATTIQKMWEEIKAK